MCLFGTTSVSTLRPRTGKRATLACQLTYVPARSLMHFTSSTRVPPGSKSMNFAGSLKEPNTVSTGASM